MRKLLLINFIFLTCCFANSVSIAQVTQQWASRFTGPGPNSTDQGHDIAVDAQGNIYVTGNVQSSQFDADIITVKYNSNGDTLWTRKYDGPGQGGDDFGFAIITDASGNIFVTGYGVGGGAGGIYDVHTIKYNSNGNSPLVKPSLVAPATKIFPA